MSLLHFSWPWFSLAFPWSSILIISATSWILIPWLDIYIVFAELMVICLWYFSTHFASQRVLLRGMNNYITAEMRITVLDYRGWMTTSYHAAAESPQFVPGMAHCLRQDSQGQILLLLLNFMKHPSKWNLHYSGRCKTDYFWFLDMKLW